MSPQLKKYLVTMKKLQNEDLVDDEVDKLEEKLEELYYELSDEEIAYVEANFEK